MAQRYKLPQISQISVPLHQLFHASTSSLKTVYFMSTFLLMFLDKAQRREYGPSFCCFRIRKRLMNDDDDIDS
jgi:hypothetical protein